MHNLSINFSSIFGHVFLYNIDINVSSSKTQLFPFPHILSDLKTFLKSSKYCRAKACLRRTLKQIRGLDLPRTIVSARRGQAPALHESVLIYCFSSGLRQAAAGGSQFPQSGAGHHGTYRCHSLDAFDILPFILRNGIEKDHLTRQPFGFQ